MTDRIGAVGGPERIERREGDRREREPVSYTHLTLPTIYSV